MTSDHSWQAISLADKLNVDLTRTDTIVCWMKNAAHYFTRTSEADFSAEPATIAGFHLLGVYKNPVDLPGVFVLFYIDEGKGILRKYYFNPRHLASCDYTAFTQANPFRLIKWQQGLDQKVYITDTIRLQR